MLPHLRLRTPIIFAFLVFFLGIFASGTFGWYARWEHFDTFLHVLGGISVAWFGLVLFQGDLAHLSRWKQTIIFVSFTTLVGIFWEFAEFMAGFGRDVVPWLWYWFHGGELADTMLDLLADILGALALTLWALERERRN
jgi:hypothetical protein